MCAPSDATAVVHASSDATVSALCVQMFADIKLEAEILCHLKGHANVVELMGMFEDDINIYVILELCTGGEGMLFFWCAREVGLPAICQGTGQA